MTDQAKKILKRRQKTTEGKITEAKKVRRRSMTNERVSIGVSIKSDLWRRLRALALTEGRLTGDLLDEAIKEYLDSHGR